MKDCGVCSTGNEKYSIHLLYRENWIALGKERELNKDEAMKQIVITSLSLALSLIGGSAFGKQCELLLLCC